MILVLADRANATARHVVGKLEQRDASVLCFEHSQFPSRARVSFDLARGGKPRRLLHAEERQHDLNDVSAAWYFRPGHPVPDERVERPDARRYVTRESAELIDDLWRTMECLWVPATKSAILRAQCKLTQLKIAAEIGFELPPTLVTNDPQEFLDFYGRNNGRIIAKPFYSGGVPVPHEESNRYAFTCYTELVSNRDVGYAQSVRHCPVIFQAYVDKAVELRITIVGEQVFAAEIHSQADARTRHDWRRHSAAQVPHRRHELPEDVARLCVALTRRLDLQFGAIDMIRTPDGRYVFLEINPSGQWLWIEELTGLPISEALCDLLLSRH